MLLYWTIWDNGNLHTSDLQNEFPIDYLLTYAKIKEKNALRKEMPLIEEFDPINSEVMNYLLEQASESSTRPIDIKKQIYIKELCYSDQ